MISIGGVTMCVRVIGMLKEMVIAGFFGVGVAVDAYMLAMLLPGIALTSVVHSLPTAMMPAYVQERSGAGPEAASSLYTNVTSLAIPLLIGTCLFIYIVGPVIVTSVADDFPTEALNLIKSLLYCVAPIVIIAGWRLLLASLLNAEERFALVAVTPVLTSSAIIILVLTFAKIFGIYTVAIGVVVGAILELIVLVALCRRLQLHILPKWDGLSPKLRQIIKEFGPLAFGSLLLTSNVIIDQAMAAMLGPGNVSALGFGNRITEVLVGLGTAALATAIFPYFSTMVAKRQWEQIRHTLATYARLLAYVTVPITIILLVFSNEIISLLFERGEFSNEDTQLVGAVQFYYALQIPFHVIAMLAVRLISALQMNRILMWGTVISLVLNVTLNLVFMELIGVAGIALSTACVILVSFTYLWTMVYRVLPR